MLHNWNILIACCCGGLHDYASAQLRVKNHFLALNRDAKYYLRHIEI